MGIETMFAGGALVALVASCWRYIKSGWMRVVSLLFVTVQLDLKIDPAFKAWCRDNCKRSGSRYGRKIDGAWVEVNNSSLSSLLASEDIGTSTSFWWYGRIPFAYTPNYYESGSNGKWVMGGVKYIRGTMDIDKLLVEACAMATSRKHNGSSLGNRFTIKNFSGKVVIENKRRRRDDTGSALLEDSEDFIESVTLGTSKLLPGQPTMRGRNCVIKPMERLAYPPYVDGLVEEAGEWLNKREWFAARGLPWRMGWLLHGKPGSGKSSLVKAVAETLNLPVMAFDLGTMTNQDMLEAWEESRQAAPCIVLIEDIDSVFDGRTNMVATNTRQSGVTFDCLLNCIDGVKGRDGVMLAVTTNHIEQLDDAMIRAGRIDRVVELGDMDAECRQRVAIRILRDWPDLIVQAVTEGDGETAAQFEMRCVSIAMDRWRGVQREAATHQ